MPDTQRPSEWIEKSEMFDFGTITGQDNLSVTQIDLTDPVINYDIVDFINNTYPGNARPYINGMLKRDGQRDFFYLSANSSKTGKLQFKQSVDDIQAGYTISMALSGEKQGIATASAPVATYTSSDPNVPGGLNRDYVHWVEPVIDNMRVPPRGNLEWLEAEKQLIKQSYAATGHNAYAYTPNLHPEYDTEIPHDNQLDIQSGPGVTVLKEGDGIFTTRLLKVDRSFEAYHGGSHWGSVLGKGHLGHVFTDQNRNQPGVKEYYRALRTTSLLESLAKHWESGTWHYAGRPSGPVAFSRYPVRMMHFINGLGEFERVYEADGVTPDVQATFFAQQLAMQHGYQGSADRTREKYGAADLNLPTLMYGPHYTMSLSVKLGPHIEAGEYVPICFIDRIDAQYHNMINDSLSEANQERINFKTDIRQRLAKSTGTSPNATDYWKHASQYYTLTTNHLHPDKRPIKDLVIYIGKPFGGNAFGGEYEMVIYASGVEWHYNTGARRRRGSEYRTYTGCESPKITRVPIDRPGRSDLFDPGEWNPLFFHFSANQMISDTKVYWSSYSPRGWYSYSRHATVGGVCVGAYGPGILDFVPGNYDNTDLVMGNYARHDRQGYGYSTNTSGSHDHHMMYKATFLAPSGKIEGLANINLHTYRDNWKVPLASGQEDDRRNITYFPQRTIGYEAIGAGSEITDTGSNWQDVDFIIDRSLETTTAAFGLGEENALVIETKLPPPRIREQLDPESVVKQLVVEVRGVEKQYMNPALILKYGVWDYTDPDNPVQVSRIVNVTPDALGVKHSNLVIVADLEGESLTYQDLNNCRLKIWADG